MKYFKFVRLTNLFLIIFFASCTPVAHYSQVTSENPLTFPKDNYAHHDYRTEWWYHTGNFKTVDGKTYGFELVFFRHRTEGQFRFGIPVWILANPIYFSHFAIVDEENRRFEYAEQVGMFSSGSREDSLLVWCEDWRLEEKDGQTHLHARLPNDDFGIDLVLTPTKPPVLHGVDGVSQKGVGGGASHYISTTRIDVKGTFYREGNAIEIDSGQAWMDHEIFSGSMSKTIQGWDWFSLQLDDGSDVMAFLLHAKDGQIDPFSSGTLVDANGKSEHFTNMDFSIDELTFWTSRESKATYPTTWRIKLPKYDGDLVVMAILPDTELLCDLSGVTYWEGPVMIEGKLQGKHVRGKGYVEMSGRAGGINDL